MDFRFSDEQRMSAEAAQQMLADECTPEALRKLLARGAPRDEHLWRTLAEGGLAAVLGPAEAGGLGLEEPHFVLIAEACGHAALPEPLIEHAGVAVPLLAAAGGDASLLEQACAGQITLAVGHPINPFVADADTAGAVLLAHAEEVHLVRPNEARLTREPSIDPFRRLFRIDWEPSPHSRLANAASGAALWADVLDRAALFTAAQCLGLAQRCVDVSVQYARERKQFGKPVGSYQAVKHQLATVQVKIEFARPVVHAAAAELRSRDRMSRARISHAKLIANEAADLAARTALQIHGAMGYSWEVDVHLFLKRALALTHAWGSPAFHRERVAQRVFGSALGPEHTFSREARHG